MAPNNRMVSSDWLEFLEESIEELGHAKLKR